jgi:hypothetical protein
MTDVERYQSGTPVQLGRPIQSLDEAWRLSKALSMANLMPYNLRGKDPDVLAILLYGQDLGLSPMQSIQGIYVVEGRPSISAQLWLALVRRAGHRVSVLEHTAETCTVHIVRGDTGEEHKATFTLAEAVAAKRVEIREGKPFARSEKGKPLPWELYPRAMLLARAVSQCCRFIAPEIALGFYSQDEVEEIAEREQVESRRADAAAAEPSVQRPVADEVAAVEAEFAAAELERARETSHDVMVTGSEEGFTWRCGVCRPGEPWTGPRLGSYEDAMADHAHYAETADRP